MSLMLLKTGNGDVSPIKKSSGFVVPLSPFKSASKGGMSPTKRARSTSFGGIGAALVRETSASGLQTPTRGVVLAREPSSPWLLPCDERSSVTNRDTMADDKDSLSIAGTRCRTMSNMSITSEAVVGTRCRAPSFHLQSPKSHRKCSSRPLPQSDVDWLLSTLSAEDLVKFDRHFFKNDSQRRFRELDTDGTGLLSSEKLQDALVDMFPTLKLELKAEGHHIPALDKSIPGLIATFDSDADGCLDLEDFMRFLKFQQAWRAQFFLSNSLASTLKIKTAVEKPAGLCKSCSLPSLVACPQPKRQRSKDAAMRPATTEVTSRASSNAMRPATTEITSRPTSSASDSVRCSSAAFQRRSALDKSRGAFYSSLLGLSSTV